MAQLRPDCMLQDLNNLLREEASFTLDLFLKSGHTFSKVAVYPNHDDDTPIHNNDTLLFGVIVDTKEKIRIPLHSIDAYIVDQQ